MVGKTRSNYFTGVLILIFLRFFIIVLLLFVVSIFAAIMLELGHFQRGNNYVCFMGVRMRRQVGVIIGFLLLGWRFPLIRLHIIFVKVIWLRKSRTFKLILLLNV